MSHYKLLKKATINGNELPEGSIVELNEDQAVMIGKALIERIVADSTQEVYKPTIVPVTVGRIVYYKSGALLAAVVTHVNEEEGLVSLLVAYPNGWTPKHGIAQGPEEGNWDWMPFQKDQQARLAK